MNVLMPLLATALLGAQEKPSQEDIRVLSELSPRIRRLVPDLDSRLSTGRPNEWTKVLLEATKFIKISHIEDRVSPIGRRDLNLLAAYAVRGARTPKEKEKVCKIVLGKKLTAAIPDVARLVEDPSSSVRAQAAYTLGAMRVESARDSLKKLMSDEVDEVRRAALISLAFLGDDKHLKELVESVGRADGIWAMRSARALRQAGFDDISPILNLSKSKDSRDRVYALRLLINVRSANVVPIVKELMQDPNHEVRIKSIGSMGRIGGPICRKACIDLLREGKECGSCRRAAVSSLGYMGVGDGSKEVLKLLSSPDALTRRTACWASGRSGVKAAARKLEELLDDESGWVREQAARSLGLIDARQSTARLAKALKDDDFDVRSQAALSLARLGAMDSIARLKELLKDPDHSVRENVAEALTRLGQRDGVELLLQESERLWVLNALRQPASWKSLASSGIANDLSGDYRTHAEHLLRDVGLKVEWPPQDESLNSWARYRGVIRSAKGRGLALEELARILGRQFSFILTGNSSVRVVSWEEALPFWRKWWKSVQPDK